jgi:hypothetical protein
MIELGSLFILSGLAGWNKPDPGSFEEKLWSGLFLKKLFSDVRFLEKKCTH